MVAGGQGVEAAAANPLIIDWVQARAKRVRCIASVCTGAFLLAATGLLDGREDAIARQIGGTDVTAEK